MALMRACYCPGCSGGVPGRFSLVAERTWFEHRRLRSGRPPRRRRAAAAAAAPGAAAAAAPTAAATTAPAAGTDTGPAAAAAAATTAAAATAHAEVHESSAPAIEPHASRPNGVCIPAQVFENHIDNFVAYKFIVQHFLSREATEDYLQQRLSAVACQTHHLLNATVDSSVDPYTKKVDCWRAGCVAYTAHRKSMNACDKCKATRYSCDGRPRMQATYCPLLPWLRMMLGDTYIGPGMVKAMKNARQDAQAGRPKNLRYWF